MGTILKQKNIEFSKFSNIPSKLKGKKLMQKIKVSANPLGLLAENRSNKKAWSRLKGVKDLLKCIIVPWNLPFGIIGFPC